MFLVQFLDGSWCSNQDCYWDNIPYKPIVKLITFDNNGNQHMIEGFDCYLYSEEAVSGLESGINAVTARYIGGFDNKTGDGELIKVIVNDLGYADNQLYTIPSKVFERRFCNKKELDFGNNAYKSNP